MHSGSHNSLFSVYQSSALGKPALVLNYCIVGFQESHSNQRPTYVVKFKDENVENKRYQFSFLLKERAGLTFFLKKAAYGLLPPYHILFFYFT